MYVLQFSKDLFGNLENTSTYEVKVFASTHESPKGLDVFVEVRAIVAEMLELWPGRVMTSSERSRLRGTG